MGRLAEAEGESEIYRDLRMKLFIDPDDMKAQYAAEPRLAEDADGRLGRRPQLLPARRIPQVKPRVITHFEPWMALTFSEGSIGGDIERVESRRSSKRSTARRRDAASQDRPADATACVSGGADRIERHRDRARRTPRRHHALLLINPHTSFFFRSELQMTSDEGLNAYGAVTWGQFFIYQGFNERAGWMHTSSGVDDIDEYLETVTKKGDGFVYKYGSEERPVHRATITVPYKTAQRDGAEGVHRLPHASRPDRPRGRRQVGQRPR